MGFIVPGFLAGLVLAGIPFVIHLIYKRRAPRIVFAAMRFLKEATRRTARRRRLDNILLLALRTLLVALLAIGLAGPVIKRAAGGGRSGRDVVIILDNSLSTAATEEGAVRFSRAKEGVGAAFSKLGPDDLATLVATAGGEAAADVALTSDITAVRTQLGRLTATNERGSIAAALGRAARSFEGSTASEKLLYLVTDMQASAFPDKAALSDEVRAALAAVPMIVYDCAASAPRNLWVAGADVYTQGGVTGTPIEVTAKIASNSPVEETVPVTLAINGQRVQSRPVTVRPSGTTEVALSAVIGGAGMVDGTVEVETSDALAADNRRYFSLVARDRIKTLIIKEENRAPEFDDDAFFLRRALDPFLGDASGGHSPFDVTVRTYAEAGNLGGYDIVYVLLRGDTGEALSGALSEYAVRGGNVVVFACDAVQAAGDREWLAARLVGVKSAEKASGESYAISSVDTDGPILAAFKDEPPALYNRARVYDYWLTDVADKGATVLSRYDTGDAALVYCPRGAGRTALFTTAPVRGMTTLQATQFFLPLVYELSYHMAAASGGLEEVYAGQPAALGPGAAHPQGLVVTASDGQQRLVEAGEGQALRYDATALLGFYRVRDNREGADTATFCVNADPAESDLTRLPEADMRKRAASARIFAVSSPGGLDEALASIEPVLALGDVILYAVLAVALLECLTANRRKAKPTKET